MHNTDSETASVACSERSGTSRTDTLLSRTTSEATLVLVRYEGKDTLVNLPDRTYNTFVDQIVRHLQGAQGYPTLFVERSCTGGRWVTVTEGAWERQFEVWEDDLPLFRITMVCPAPVADKHRTISIAVKTLTGKTVRLRRARLIGV